ncbi:MAG: sulfatase [Cellvibrionales bacterium]|jgi:arylsulfatase A-like enzyme|nr:sulfatase [Cellvibrionales bacterium]
MKKFFVLVVLPWFFLLPVVAAEIQQVPTKKPMNFIVILLDDLGLHDVGFAGNDFVETPAIDQLAKDGVVFTQAYADAPNCAPSRAAILSGQYAPRTGVYTVATGDMGDVTKRKLLTPKNKMFLPEQVYTIAELLRDHGYATASIGKWNLGHGAVRGPEGQGFDLNIAGHRGGVGQSHFAPYSTQLPNVQNAPAGEYLTDRLNAETLRFIEQHKTQPFFVYLSHYAPHFPIQAPAEAKKKYEEKREAFCGKKSKLTFCEMSDYYPEYAAMIERIDRGLAQLRAQLAKDGLDKNTTIVLMSDNGGYPFVRDPNAQRGQKSQLYEGGIHVPMVWLVPGNQAAAETDVPVSGVDIYPTFAALAGIDIKKLLLDGTDLSPLIFSPSRAFPQRDLFWYLPGYTTDSTEEQEGEQGNLQLKPQEGFTQTPAVAMRRGNWKLIWYYDGAPTELYNVRVDPLEKYNQFLVEKKRGAEMLQALKQWLVASGGVVELPKNPAYQP